MAITTTNLGRVMIIPKGIYNPSVTYEILDLVESSGSSYVSKIGGNIGNLLNDSGSWQVVSEKGDPFLYEDFTAGQILNLQQPALDAASLTATSASQAVLSASIATTSASLAAVSASLATQASILATQNSSLATTDAIIATESASLAATSASIAAVSASASIVAISPAVINNEQVQAEVYNNIIGRLTALETFISSSVFGNVVADKLEIVNEFNIYGTSNLFITGAVAPAVVPDYVGQFYINTATGVTYQAKGVASSGDWKQTSN